MSPPPDAAASSSSTSNHPYQALFESPPPSYTFLPRLPGAPDSPLPLYAPGRHRRRMSSDSSSDAGSSSGEELLTLLGVIRLSWSESEERRRRGLGEEDRPKGWWKVKLLELGATASIAVMVFLFVGALSKPAMNGRGSSKNGLETGFLGTGIGQLELDEFAPPPFAPYTPLSAVESSTPASAAAVPTSSVVPAKTVAAVQAEERFISFLPHSGFHNQRIALVNALSLAALTNRTLLLPPARMGRAEPWNPLNTLRTLLLRGAACKAKTAGHLEPRKPRTPKGCDDWTEVPWSFLFGEVAFGRLLGQHGIKVKEWNSYDFAQLSAFSNGSVYALPDTSRRMYRIYETREKKTPLGNFAQRMELEDLKARTEKTIAFGSLFGGARMVFSKPDSWLMFSSLRDGMVLDVEGLGDLTTKATEALRSASAEHKFLSVHARVGDGGFQIHAVKNMQDTLRSLAEKLGVPATLMREKFGLPVAPLTLSKRSFDADSDDEEELVNEVAHPLRRLARRSNSEAPASQMVCPRALHTDPALAALNTPVYLSTDSRTPSADPALAPLLQALPCAFVWSDLAAFRPELEERLASWQSPWEQGRLLGPYLRPLLDAEIVARGGVFQGTQGSTFSGYVEAILFKHYHP